MWIRGGLDASTRTLIRQGHNLINWSSSGMRYGSVTRTGHYLNYPAISDLNLTEL